MVLQVLLKQGRASLWLRWVNRVVLMAEKSTSTRLPLSNIFFSHIQEIKPTVLAAFNRDFFDARAKANGVDMKLAKTNANAEYGLFSMGQTWFIPTTRKSRPGSGDYREIGIQRYWTWTRIDDTVSLS